MKLYIVYFMIKKLIEIIIKKYINDEDLEIFFDEKQATKKFDTIDPNDPFQLAYESFVNYFQNKDVI